MKFLAPLAFGIGCALMCVLLALFFGFLGGAFISGCSHGVTILPPPQTAASGTSAAGAHPTHSR